MGLIKFLRQIFRRKSKEEALQSDQSALESNQSPNQSFESDSNLIQINQSINHQISQQEKSSIELEKDSLQLGLAAGYAGRALKEIESSLTRIESQMITKDWFTLQLRDQLIKMLEEHEENEQKRFETILEALNSLKEIAQKAPEPVKSELLTQIRAMETKLPLTRRMNEILEILKQVGEISYSELAARLNISESALRGLLSHMAKRTSIKRFIRNGRGWVTLDRSDSNHFNQSSEQSS